MKEKDKYKKSKISDYLRYTGGKMTDSERNAFERELQKDSFAAEATEGLSELSPEDVLYDISRLEKQIKSRTVRREKLMYYKIAASIAVLMVLSSLYIFISRTQPSEKLDDLTYHPVTIEIPESKAISKPETITSKDKIARSEKKGENLAQNYTRAAVSSEIRSIPSAVRKLEPANVMKVNKPDSVIITKNVSDALTGRVSGVQISHNRIKGRVISSEDKMPIPGAIVTIKGTDKGAITDTDGYFNVTLPDEKNRKLVASFIGMETKEIDAEKEDEVNISLEPSSVSLSEVVVVGYGIKRTETEQEDKFSGYIPPQPANGKSEFDKYVQENLHRPDSSTAGQRVVVVVSFLVHTNGIIDSIRIVRSPGKLFSDEAIRIIKSGPAWKPAQEDGKIIEDEVRVRIVFR